jgi:hypothetical protein
MSQTALSLLLSILLTTMTVVTHPCAQRRDRDASGTSRQTLAPTAPPQTSCIVRAYGLPRERSLG